MPFSIFRCQKCCELNDNTNSNDEEEEEKPKRRKSVDTKRPKSPRKIIENSESKENDIAIELFEIAVGALKSKTKTQRLKQLSEIFSTRLILEMFILDGLKQKIKDGIKNEVSFTFSINKNQSQVWVLSDCDSTFPSIVGYDSKEHINKMNSLAWLVHIHPECCDKILNAWMIFKQQKIIFLEKARFIVNGDISYTVLVVMPDMSESLQTISTVKGVLFSISKEAWEHIEL